MDSSTPLIILLVLLVFGSGGFCRCGRWFYLPGMAFGAR
jgi:hypothetical protein